MNTGPYCKARKRLPLSLLKEAVASTAQALNQQASEVWLWKGFQVALVDGKSIQLSMIIVG